MLSWLCISALRGTWIGFLFLLLASVWTTFAASSVSRPGAKSRGSCPPRWYLFQGKCYRYHTRRTSWNQAVSICSTSCSSITDRSTTEAIMSEHYANKPLSNTSKVWVSHPSDECIAFDGERVSVFAKNGSQLCNVRSMFRFICITGAVGQGWTAWETVGSCQPTRNATCGRGSQKEVKRCACEEFATFGFAKDSCKKTKNQIVPCRKECKAKTEWDAWSSWTSCSGSATTRYQSRQCLLEVYRCEGIAVRTRPCEEPLSQPTSSSAAEMSSKVQTTMDSRGTAYNREDSSTTAMASEYLTSRSKDWGTTKVTTPSLTYRSTFIIKGTSRSQVPTTANASATGSGTFEDDHKRKKNCSHSYRLHWAVPLSVLLVFLILIILIRYVKQRRERSVSTHVTAFLNDSSGGKSRTGDTQSLPLIEETLSLDASTINAGKTTA